MPRTAHTNRADTVRFCPLDAEVDHPRRDDLADSVLPVEGHDGAIVEGRGDLGDGAHRPRAKALDIPGQAQRAVRGVTRNFGDRQAVGQQLGVGPGNVEALQNSGHRGGEVVRGDPEAFACISAHSCSCRPWCA